MQHRKGDKTFREDVFPAELAEIRDRRRAAGDDRRLPDQTTQIKPNPDYNLTGLAFSGGGIRSASFCLGVIQYLIRRGLFKKIDYLSTVSGGGFTGSCLSSLMQIGHQGERLLVDREGMEEPAALNHLRNGSNYLLPVGTLNRLRMPSLFIIGVLQTLLLFLPPVILMVFLTELFFELTRRVSLPFGGYWLALLGIVPLAIAVFVRPILQLRRRTWEVRDRADRRLGLYLFLAVVSLLLVPLLAGLNFLVDSDLATVTGSISTWLTSQFQLGIRNWLLWVVLLGVALLIFGLTRWPKTILIAMIGAAGPLLLFVFYLFCCIETITSPAVRRQPADAYASALIDYQKTGNPEQLQAAVDEILDRKGFVHSDYRTDFDSVNKSNPQQTELKIYRRKQAEEPWLYGTRWRALTTRKQDELTITIDPLRTNSLFIPDLSLLRLRTEWTVYLSGLLLWLFNYLFINVNRMSLHPFYRDRLSRTFLIQGTEDGIESADKLRLSQLRSAGSIAPYHLVNTALNLQGNKDPQLRQRKTVPFLLSKRFCGSDYTGFCQTEDMENLDPNLDLGTAMAISAAAAGPMMGVKTLRSLSLVLTFLNIRLAYWLPHPGWVKSSTWWDWLVHRNPGLVSLITEALGAANDRHRFVNCSDGGHIENLGVYELLKRRCRTIICVDGGADPGFKFFDLTTLQRYANIDLDAQIDIELGPLLPDKNGVSEQHFAIGDITYHDGGKGILIYLKLSYSGDEPEYIRFYKRSAPKFPHESTADQFFKETQFEVYRRLGSHVAQSAFANSKVCDCLKLNSFLETAQK